MSARDRVKTDLAKMRPDEFDWVAMAKKEGFNTFVELVSDLTPEALHLIPKLPPSYDEAKSKELPSLHEDVLWMYGVFLSMYQKRKEAALTWFKESLKSSIERYENLFKDQPWNKR
jgi:hypothetical protein